MPRPARLAAAALALALATAPAAALPFTDAELIDGFIQTVFGAETANGEDEGSASRQIKKFTGPVRYHIVSTSRVDQRETLRGFLADLSDSVANLQLEETGDYDAAEMVIFLTDRRDYKSVIRRTVWEGVNTEFLEENACSAVLAARSSGIERANIYLVADEGFAGLSHCMVEEIAQSLGPANDSVHLKDSIFNDESELNVFGLFDWYILNMLYDERIHPGMGEADVLPLLPTIIADVRARLPQIRASGNALAHHFTEQP